MPVTPPVTVSSPGVAPRVRAGTGRRGGGGAFAGRRRTGGSGQAEKDDGYQGPAHGSSRGTRPLYDGRAEPGGSRPCPRPGAGSLRRREAAASPRAATAGPRPRRRRVERPTPSRPCGPVHLALRARNRPTPAGPPRPEGEEQEPIVPPVDWILVTNDDGVEVPSLPPLARAIATLGPVRVVVPDGERSWVGKAITRFETGAGEGGGARRRRDARGERLPGRLRATGPPRPVRRTAPPGGLGHQRRLQPRLGLHPVERHRGGGAGSGHRRRRRPGPVHPEPHPRLDRVAGLVAAPRVHPHVGAPRRPGRRPRRPAVGRRPAGRAAQRQPARRRRRPPPRAA